jgi:arginase
MKRKGVEMTRMERTVRIIGIPTDLGQSHRGVDVGLSAVRYAGLSERLSRLGYRIEDACNIPVPVRAAVV